MSSGGRYILTHNADNKMNIRKIERRKKVWKNDLNLIKMTTHTKKGNDKNNKKKKFKGKTLSKPPITNVIYAVPTTHAMPPTLMQSKL